MTEAVTEAMKYFQLKASVSAFPRNEVMWALHAGPFVFMLFSMGTFAVMANQPLVRLLADTAYLVLHVDTSKSSPAVS